MKNLEQIILSIIEKHPKTKVQFDRARQKVCGQLKIKQPSNRELLQAYHNLIKKKSIERDEKLEKLLRKADIRTLSGIAIVTSLTKPYSCPGKCIYCPTETRMPKSYLASEPAAARALALEFDPYVQMQRRILMLEANGHPTEKIEYIIKGGTWNAYPLKYQYWFILDSFKACNQLTLKHKNIKTLKHELSPNSSIEDLQKALEKEQKKNETAKYRIIGLTLETRPDAITPETIYHMRLQGCTRIELGLQAPDNRILELIKRGHSIDQFKDAMFLLRQAGFKVDLHFMPDLPGTTAEHDVEMYKMLFEDPGFCPDMVKIYPNTVIPSAELYEWYKQGKYKPYGEKKLFEALLQMKLITPRYCRISRLIRDIPTNEIKAGNSITNLRESLKKELVKREEDCVCLRCREVSRQIKNIPKNIVPELFVDEYQTTGGTEYFLTFEDENRKAVFAFLRLRIPTVAASKKISPEACPEQSRRKEEGQLARRSFSEDGRGSENLYDFLPEIRDCAFVRELHTYGQLLNIGEKDKKASQHKGIGKKLLKEAEKIAKENGFKKIAVISGVGVRDYYRKNGYKKIGTYMVKKI